MTETILREVEAAAGATGLRIQIRNASTSREINAAFATFAAERPDAIFVGPGFLFNSRRVQLVHLATLHRVPATYESREFPEIGGLMSYGTSVTNAYRQMGLYTGRILKGRSPRTCRSCSRQSSNWSSMPRPLRCSASPFRLRCSRLPTR